MVDEGFVDEMNWFRLELGQFKARAGVDMLYIEVGAHQQLLRHLPLEWH